MDPITTAFNKFVTIEGETTKGIDKKEVLIQNLSAKERATLRKVLEFVGGKRAVAPPETDVEALNKAIEKKSTRDTTKLGKRIAYVFGRDSYKKLMKESAGAQSLKAGLDALASSATYRVDTAKGHFKEAIKAGNMRAHYHLAIIDKNPISAFDHLEKGAKGGDSFCQLELAKRLMSKEYRYNFKKAEKWLLKVVDQLPEAKELATHLGHIYEESADYGRALKLYKAAHDEPGMQRMRDMRGQRMLERFEEEGLFPKGKQKEKAEEPKEFVKPSKRESKEKIEEGAEEMEEFVEISLEPSRRESISRRDSIDEESFSEEDSSLESEKENVKDQIDDLWDERIPRISGRLSNFEDFIDLGNPSMKDLNRIAAVLEECATPGMTEDSICQRLDELGKEFTIPGVGSVASHAWAAEAYAARIAEAQKKTT